MKKAEARIVPPIYLLLTMVSMFILNLAFPLEQWVPDDFQIWGNLGVLIAFGWIYYCVRAFRKARTPLRPFLPVTAMITDGPFRYSRNPVYLGMFVLLTAWAVSLGSASPWLGVLFFIPFIHFGWVLPEEAQMEREVGAEYLEYKKRVRRWL